MLWGNETKKKADLIDHSRHLVLTTSHPAHRENAKEKFLDCGHFTKCNKYLKDNEKKAINWHLTE